MLNCNSCDYTPSLVPVARRFVLKNNDFALPPACQVRLGGRKEPRNED